MTHFYDIAASSFAITTPICVILLLGSLFKKYHLIDEHFVNVASKLVFNVTLPIMLFFAVSRATFNMQEDLLVIFVGVIGTFILWLLLEFITQVFVSTTEERGVIVQGGFRANMGIFGLAYCANAYGDAGIAKASIYLAVVTIFYNIFTVISLQRSLSGSRGIADICKNIARNPLILAICGGLLFSYSNSALPQVVVQSGEYLTRMTLPLALICTGASIDFSALKGAKAKTFFAASYKLILVPIFMTVFAYIVGLNGIELGIILLMSSAPTAAASYVMVRAMGGNTHLAANIIALTTLGSLVTTSVLIISLKMFNLM